MSLLNGDYQDMREAMEILLNVLIRLMSWIAINQKHESQDKVNAEVWALHGIHYLFPKFQD